MRLQGPDFGFCIACPRIRGVYQAQPLHTSLGASSHRPLAGDLERQARAGLLLRRLQGGERLTPQEAEFLWMEQSKLEEADVEDRKGEGIWVWLKIKQLGLQVLVYLSIYQGSILDLQP